jgi:hypothetical protein
VTHQQQPQRRGGAEDGTQDVPLQPLRATYGRSRRKYGNTPTVVDGHRFDSKKEAARFADLSVALRAGEITDLRVHERFPLVVHEQDCGAYESDFTYTVTATGERVVEDVKSAMTRKLPVYRLKRKLMWALYGISVREV